MTTEARSITLRALRVLEAIAEAGGPLAVIDVARHVNVDRSTAHRILVTLMEAGYVERDGSGMRYALAHKVLWLAKSLLDKDDSNLCISHALAELAAQTGETVHYSVLDGDAALLTQSAKGTQRLSVDVAIGERSPLHATSAGKVLLAFSDAGIAEEAIAQGLRKYAANTIVEAAALLAELDTVRSQRFAYDLHEFADDMQCVAVPVFSRRGALQGTISFSGPDSRFTTAHLDRLRDVAMATSATLSATLNGR